MSSNPSSSRRESTANLALAVPRAVAPMLTSPILVHWNQHDEGGPFEPKCRSGSDKCTEFVGNPGQRRGFRISFTGKVDARPIRSARI